MEWTRDKTVKLINEYRNRRELWDMTADDYRKKDIKAKYLMEVSKILGGDTLIPIEDIEKKFHTLRTQYHREINRMKRKDSYNSKWFAFDMLKFLSSPKACRTNKGRIKSEITEEGTVTTKYIISEAGPHETSGGSINSSSTIQDEFLTIHRKPSNTSTRRTTTSRSHELEKLIEETTKDVDESDELKPKVTLKEITLPIDNVQNYEAQHDVNMANQSDQMQTDDDEQQQHEVHHQVHGQQHSQHQHQHMDDDVVEGIAIQSADGEITYHQTTGAPTTTLHGLPRIIKIQRRDTIAGNDDDYYHHPHHQPQQQQHQHQQQTQHIHALPAGTKRIFYNSNGQQHTATILTPNAAPSQPNTTTTTLLTATSVPQRGSLINAAPQSPTSSPNQHSITRDEFTTYGEYVANEMRNLTNREVLIALKHKINTALFEANMAELQK